MSSYQKKILLYPVVWIAAFTGVTEGPDVIVCVFPLLLLTLEEPLTPPSSVVRNEVQDHMH